MWKYEGGSTKYEDGARKFRISNLEYRMANIEYQISNFEYRISNSQTSKPPVNPNHLYIGSLKTLMMVRIPSL